MKGLKSTRLKAIADNLPRALAPLFEASKISNILYKRFRSEAIHRANVILDPRRFFDEVNVYWKPMSSDYYGEFERVEFPARFLLSLLERCIVTYRAALVAKGRVPPNVHFHAFTNDVFQSLDLLDQDLLPEGGRVRYKIER